MSASSSGIGQSFRIERTSHWPLMRDSTNPSWGSNFCWLRVTAPMRRTGTFSSATFCRTRAAVRASLTAMSPFLAFWLSPSRASTRS